MKRAQLGNAVGQGILAAWFAFVFCALVIIPVAMLVSVAGGVLAGTFLLLVCLSVGLAAGVLTTWGALKIHQEQSCAENGLCIACGYDLRASNGRCPECGMLYARPAEPIIYDSHGSPAEPHAFQIPTPKSPG